MSRIQGLEVVTDGIWDAIDRVNAGGGVLFDSRMSVVRLRDGSVLLYSPISIDDALADQITAIGPVAHIVAPNGFHHLFAGEAKTRFPEATLWASRALQVKGIEVGADRWLGEGDPPFADELEAIEIAGAPKGQEWCLLHDATRTLIVSDLVFHIQDPPSFMTKVALRIAGAHGGRLAQSRLWRALVKDKSAARASIERLLERDFDRLVPGHGAIIETGAHERLMASLWWMRGAAKPH